MAKAVSKARLTKAAKELNEVLGLDPQIVPDQEEDGLVEAVLEAAGLLEPEDKVSKATMKTIDDLKALAEAGDTGEAEAAAADDDENADDENADDDGDGDDSNDDGDEPEAESKKSAKPAKAKAKTAKKSAGKKYETTALGSRVGTQAEQLDKVLLAAKGPITVEEIAEQSGFSKGRVKIHLNYLLKKDLLTEADGKYTVNK